MAKKEKVRDLSTEEKILKAATKVFTEKGYAGTRTRDIAEEAGINLALLNYYFRSKEKLFEKIMFEKIQQMFGTILPILIDEKTTLDQKITLATNSYLDLLIDNPNLPLFVISEIQKGNSELQHVMPVEEILKKSTMLQQIAERNSTINPLHFLVNFLSMTIFPFVTSPVLQKFGIFEKESFRKFVEERRTLIPIWLNILLDA